MKKQCHKSLLLALPKETVPNRFIVTSHTLLLTSKQKKLRSTEVSSLFLWEGNAMAAQTF